MSKTTVESIEFEHCVAFYRRESRLQDDVALAEWLNTHPQIALRAQRQAAVEDHLQQHYAPVADEPIPQRLLAPKPAARNHHWPTLATAASLALVAGLAWAFWPAQPQATRISGPIQTAQKMTLPPSSRQDNARLKNVVATPASSIVAPDLAAQGYRLTARHALPDKAGKAAVEFVYENRQGEDLRVLALAHSPQPIDSSLKSPDHNGLSVVHWPGQHANYTLIGKQPRATLYKLAQQGIGKQQTTATAEATINPLPQNAAARHSVPGRSGNTIPSLRMPATPTAARPIQRNGT